MKKFYTILFIAVICYQQFNGILCEQANAEAPPAPPALPSVPTVNAPSPAGLPPLPNVPTHPGAAPVGEQTPQGKTILSEDDKKSVKAFREFLNKAAPSVKKEIKEYREKKRMLDFEAQNLYDSLSNEAREFLTEQSGQLKILPENVKKYLKEKYIDKQ